MISKEQIQEFKECAARDCPKRMEDYSEQDLRTEWSGYILEAHEEALEYSDGSAGDYEEQFQQHIDETIDSACIYYSDCRCIIALVKEYDAFDESPMTGERFRDEVELAYTNLDYFVRECML